MTMLRIPDILDKSGGAGRSALYTEIARGTFPPGVKISERCVAWPEHEVDAIIAARVRGESTEAIKRLVEQLLAARKTYGLPAADSTPAQATTSAQPVVGLDQRRTKRAPQPVSA